MSGIATAIVTSAVVAGGVSAYSANKSSKAAKEAAAQQAASQDKAIQEQRTQFQQLQETLRPYVEAGKVDLTQPYIGAGPGALQAMQGLAGLRGAGEQQAAINQIQQGARFQELARQGEQGILQNAAATGGLRGGNTQAALAQFRPALLNQLIESQYGKLAGLTQLGSTSAENLLRLGQASAAGVGAAGQQSAQNIGNLMAAQGAAQAGGIIGAANAQAQGLGAVTGGMQQGIQNYMLFNAINNPNRFANTTTNWSKPVGGFEQTFGAGASPEGY
jgi:hypothetical protein